MGRVLPFDTLSQHHPEVHQCVEEWVLSRTRVTLKMGTPSLYSYVINQNKAGIASPKELNPEMVQQWPVLGVTEVDLPSISLCVG